MRAVTQLTNEEYEKYSKIQQNLRQYKEDTLIKYNTYRKYGYYTFDGKITEYAKRSLGRLLTPEEIIILVDGGFHHFGAECYIAANGKFYGSVNYD